MTSLIPAPKVAPGLVWRLLDNSAVVVSPRSGEVRVLNPIGTAIWQLVVENEDLDSIENHLIENYEVTQERAHEDLLSFIEELFDRGILVPVDVVS
jgi:hypothetical protein